MAPEGRGGDGEGGEAGTEVVGDHGRVPVRLDAEVPVRGEEEGVAGHGVEVAVDQEDVAARRGHRGKRRRRRKSRGNTVTEGSPAGWRYDCSAVLKDSGRLLCQSRRKTRISVD